MIDQRIKEQLIEIGRKEKKINKIILFGSRAVGDNTAKSDIDLAFVAPNMTDREWAALTFDIEDELDTLLFLDLVKFDEAPIELKNEITKNGQILYDVETVVVKETDNKYGN